MRLTDNQKVIALNVVQETGAILTATENGYGKRTDITEYRSTGRGGQGVISIHVNERNGNVVKAVQVQEDDEAMLISDGGTMVRLRVNEIGLIGRNTQGVRLVNLAGNEKLVGLQRVEEQEVEVDEAQGDVNSEGNDDESV